jgi:hypothetical protein
LVAIAIAGNEVSGISSISHGKGDEKKADYKLALEIGGDLSAQALNSAKGSALQELGNLAWSDEEAYGRYAYVLAKVAGAEAEPHIHAALGMLLLSALKHEHQGGVPFTVATARACPEGLFTNQGQRAISWSADLEPAAFGEIVQNVWAKGDPVSAAFAAIATFGRCLEDPDYLELSETLISQSEEFRAAAAAVAVANLSAYPQHCGDWLIRFFGDPSKMVRQEAADCFRLMKAEKIGDFRSLYEAYVASPYFTAERGYFLHRLEDAPPAMADFVLTLLENVLDAVSKSDERTSTYEIYGASDIILKIYASNLDDPEIVRRSLDLIDRMIVAGLMHSELEAA